MEALRGSTCVLRSCPRGRCAVDGGPDHRGRIEATSHQDGSVETEIEGDAPPIAARAPLPKEGLLGLCPAVAAVGNSQAACGFCWRWSAFVRCAPLQQGLAVSGKIFSRPTRDGEELAERGELQVEGSGTHGGV